LYCIFLTALTAALSFFQNPTLDRESNPHAILIRIWIFSPLKMYKACGLDSRIYGVASQSVVESSWNVMAHCDARDGKWRGNWRMDYVASTLHTTSGAGVSSTTTADAHTSAASIRLNWGPRRFKWTRPFRRKKKSGFCACAITFETHCTKFQMAPVFSFQIASGSKKKVHRYAYLSEVKASHSHKMWTEVSSSVPNFLQVGLLL
jgi:hypothetical protein